MVLEGIERRYHVEERDRSMVLGERSRVDVGTAVAFLVPPLELADLVVQEPLVAVPVVAHDLARVEPVEQVRLLLLELDQAGREIGGNAPGSGDHRRRAIVGIDAVLDRGEDVEEDPIAELIRVEARATSVIGRRQVPPDVLPAAGSPTLERDEEGLAHGEIDLPCASIP